MLRLPGPRGPLSAALVQRLPGPPGLPPETVSQISRAGARGEDVLSDDDLQLFLAICYELSYGGFEEVDDEWEWEPTLLGVRRSIEARFEAALRKQVPAPDPAPDPAPEPIDVALRRIIDADDSPSLSAYLMRQATLDQFRTFVAHRSVYQLKEADPHTWGIPRLSGAAKAALVEIQMDEYGGGRTEHMHATLFARTMRALGLDDRPGAYWADAPGTTLAVVNLMSMFGLHRRWRGALVGHLAALEMTSTAPNRRYGNGLRRLGFGREATRFYDEHVEADAVHEQVAGVDLCGSFVAAEPERRDDVLFGAAACLLVEGRFAGALLRRWQPVADSASVVA